MAAVGLAMVLSASAAASAQSPAGQQLFEAGFDDPQPSWRQESVPGRAALLTHSRTAREFHAGGGAELVRFSTTDVETVRLIHELPPARVFEEFSTSVWVRSNRQSVLLAARVRFPHAIDPRTNEPLTVDVFGERYTSPQQWQQVTCATTDAAIRQSLIRLRNQVRQLPAGVQFDTREAYVDAVVVNIELQPGVTEVYLDDLSAGPIVTPATTTPDRGRGPENGSGATRVLIGDDHFRRTDGRPFVLRFAPYHGESAAGLASCGVNAVWIPDYTDAWLLSELEEAGLYAIAELPMPADIDELSRADDLQVGLLPFSDHPQVLFWNIGTRLSPEEIQQVSAWTEMVRSSDHEFSRLLLGDVVGAERDFHRRLDCLGASRHFLHTSASPGDYRDFLTRKRDLGFPDKPMFTYVQTEPSPGLLSRWPAGRALPAIEPEQIWLQGYAALAAGFKGIGFWKHTAFTPDAEAGDERVLAISLLNRHIALLEPWLATGKIAAVLPASFTDPSTETRSGAGWGLQLFGGAGGSPAEPAESAPVQVSMLQSDRGLVLLPVWYEEDAQYQPGPMRATELYFTIPFAGEDVLQAWLVTTTDVSTSPLELTRVSGGHQVRLTGFDQHAAVIITRDSEMIEELRRRIVAGQEEAARSWIDLASAKLRRIEGVHAELAVLGASVENGNGWLDLANELLEEAEAEFDAGRYSDTRRISQRAMAVLRIYQRAHWERAVRGLSSGVSSPYTICFQTLPEHQRLLGRVGNGSMQRENLLKSGEFEDRDTMFARGWRNPPIEDPSINVASQLRRRNAVQGDYALHLTAERRTPGPPVDDASIRWISPPVSVYAGQIVHVGGQVFIEKPAAERCDGLLIYETLHGSLGALRWRAPAVDGEWESFQLIREVHESGEMRVVIELRGLGEVSVDDIRVIAIDP